MQEKFTPSMEGLDFDKQDLIFASFVKYACEAERKRDLAAAQGEEMVEDTAGDKRSRQWLEKYLRWRSRIQALKKGYQGMQKMAVFLVVLFLGFTYAAVNVEAVNRAVVEWLTNVYPTHTELSIHIGDDSKVDFSKVSVNWVPEGCTVDQSQKENGFITIYYQDVVFSNICLYTADTNMSLNTEDARTVYLDLPNYDSVLLIERKDIKMVVAVNEDIVIFIDGMINKERTASLGELLKILQNISY